MEAFNTPVVKKPRLDTTDMSSYRTISDLLVLSTVKLIVC